MNTLLAISFSTASTPLNIVLLVIGIIIVLKGADWLTEGAVSVASRAGVSQMVIGLTIVAMGTSMPELCVSLVSAIKGTSDLAVGNVVGSNIFNTLLIVGCSAMVAPVAVRRQTVRKDFPFAVAASILMLVFALDNEISRADSLCLLVGFIIFIVVTLRGAKAESPDSKTQGDAIAGGSENGAQQKNRSAILSLLMMAVGLACLILGSNVFVENATFLAKQLGVSDAVIGLTIVAGGTSLPELATSVVAAKKGNSGIAIGNVLGSNVFNILMIIGVTGSVCPMHIAGITPVDLAVMLASMLLIWLFARSKYTVERWEGAVLTAIFIAYISYIII